MVRFVLPLSGQMALTHQPTRHADSRNIPALQRIGDPDDIIASVRVENGEVSVSALPHDFMA